MYFLIHNEIYVDNESVGLPHLQSVLMDSLHPVGEYSSVTEYTLTKVSFERIQLGLTGSVVLTVGKVLNK